MGLAGCGFVLLVVVWWRNSGGFGVVIMAMGGIVCLLVLFCYLDLLDTITLWVVTATALCWS